MTGIKRWLAGLLSGMIVFSGISISAEDTGPDIVEIQESVVTREGEDAGTLEDRILQIAELMQTEQIQNLLKIEDVKTISSEVIWKALVWLAQNRPVTMKILAELGVEEADRRCIEKLWDSAEKISDAVQEFQDSEEGKKLTEDAEALRNDPEFLEAMKNLQALLTSDDVDSIMDGIQETVESGRAAGHGDGSLTQEALDRQLDRTSFVGSLLIRLLAVLDESEWARDSLPDLMNNENFWLFLLDLSEGDKTLDQTIQKELGKLAEDPEIDPFIRRTISAWFTLMRKLKNPDDDGGEAGKNLQEETEDSTHE